MNRKQELIRLLRMSRQRLVKKAGNHLVVLKDIDALHEHFARAIAREIQENTTRNRDTKLILPVGPTGQYPILADIIRSERISLKRCWFFFMDEYCDDNGIVLPKDHPLSFRGEMEALFFSKLSKRLAVPQKQVFFPDQNNVAALATRIDAVGGIDTCYGGIGIHGHVAFNEPEPNVKDTGPGMVYLNEITRTINAVRAKVGGNLVNFPRKAFTLGMRQILGARRIRLYCRNGIALDWANTVLRLALLGEPGDDYPVTYIRDHKDYIIVTDEETLKSPEHII